MAARPVLLPLIVRVDDFRHCSDVCPMMHTREGEDFCRIFPGYALDQDPRRTYARNFRTPQCVASGQDLDTRRRP